MIGSVELAIETAADLMDNVQTVDALAAAAEVLGHVQDDLNTATRIIRDQRVQGDVSAKKTEIHRRKKEK